MHIHYWIIYNKIFLNVYIDNWINHVNIHQLLKKEYLVICFRFHYCRDPNLGLATKARACKDMGQEWSPSHISCSQECRRVWGNELTHSQVELESQWIPESSEIDCKGKKSLDWIVPYTNGKFLEFKCLKWAHTSHLSI